MRSTPDKPGFHMYFDQPPHELAVGAIGKVWQGSIPFVHVSDAFAFAQFDEADFVKVAWAIRVSPRGANDTRVEIEVRVDATDDAAWRKFKNYFRFIGIGSHFIRHELLRAVVHRFGRPDEDARKLPGDELLPDAAAQMTHFIEIRAKPEAIWPWLVQMGGQRAGFYSYDLLDNGGRRSARELHPELMNIAVGDVLPATPEGADGFEVLRLEAPRVFVLGGLTDSETQRQLVFRGPRPSSYWQATWSFVLEPLDGDTTRLHVRVRAAFSKSAGLHAAWIRPVHGFMEAAQLRHLKARVEGTAARDGAFDVLEGIGGAGRMLFAMITPFLRGRRMVWGCDDATADLAYRGDDLIAQPRGSWTHAIEIAAPASRVWPWIAQIGADRAGFYSYQWLENIAGCNVRNAESVHPEWQLKVGDPFVLHPKQPPLTIVDVEEGRYLLARGEADRTKSTWLDGTWLLLVEPIDAHRCRFISRFRVDYSNDLASAVAMALTQPIGFVMDRRMLLGVKERAERRTSVPLLHLRTT